MKTVVTILSILFSSLFYSQTKFEEGMGKAFALWGEGKNKEASALFERIASAEKNSWLPNYYVALVNTTTAFQTENKEEVNNLLNKAQVHLDIELAKNDKNPELLALQALIHTAWIAFDPMTNGMKLSGKVMELYAKAEAIAPDNPRVVFGKAEFELGSAKYFGTDIKPICARIQKALQLFDTFKPETSFHPKWGKERALQVSASCQ